MGQVATAPPTPVAKGPPVTQVDTPDSLPVFAGLIASRPEETTKPAPAKAPEPPPSPNLLDPSTWVEPPVEKPVHSVVDDLFPKDEPEVAAPPIMMTRYWQVLLLLLAYESLRRRYWELIGQLAEHPWLAFALDALEDEWTTSRTTSTIS